MTIAVVVALGVTMIFAYAAAPLARRLPPAIATRLIVPSALLVTASSWFVLAVAAFTWIGQNPRIARAGDWSADTLRETDPIPRVLAGLSLVLLATVCFSTVRTAARRGRALLEVHRACRDLGSPGAVVVIEDERAEAFTTPEARGRIVVTSGLMRALNNGEQRALLAHEGSHVTHRHAWWLVAADLATAANPLFAPAARAIAHAIERWADEDAADAVSDRRLVARTVARAALLKRHATALPTPAATGGDIPARVTAMLAPRPRRRPVLVAVVTALLVVAATAAIAVQRDAEQLFDDAGTHGTYGDSPR